MPKVERKIPVKDYVFDKNLSVNELVEQMDAAWGFTAGKLAVGVSILEDMVNSKGCVKFLSFPADICATGTRGVIKELVKRKMVDVIITTCGTLDHDVARCYRDYYKGSFVMNDSKLHQEGVNRLGNVLVPNDSYGIVIEKQIISMLETLYKEGKREFSTTELCREIGLRCCNEDSILYWAAKNNIPIFVPGITDGSVGYQLWFFSQDHKDFRINLLKDEDDLNNIVFDAKKSGALIIGGGISKHHTIWWNQFKDGLDYVVYISTAVEWDGSLSGARPREAVSWGKISEKAKRTMIEGDATMIMPIMMSSLIERLNKKKVDKN
ncbi:MAG: deoxyhypusine synthase [Candidatus Bathyarchaeota archaeon]|nr:deoxyhypusine synthase [Candidatus Termiticorpusculum sp.]MCL2868772.1 deoxyhypusine synthase [Candidatus Termiticorpusculum sp.]